MMGVRGLLKLKVLSTLLLLGLILSNGMVVGVNRAFAQVEPPDVEVVNPYFTVTEIEIKEGLILEKEWIAGPPDPPAEFEAERQASIQPLPSTGILPSFPSFDWVFGCSAVSGAMIAGYYDNNGYSNMYAGPTNGGVMPNTDTSWLTWSDGYVTYPNNPLIASHNGVDGRTTRGSIDDYWIKYGSTADDPFITGGWTQHTWSDAIGDYMKTSQSTYGSTDGSTWFYNYSSSTKLTCSAMESLQDEGFYLSDLDGTYGRKLFYEARGYSVGDCFNQKTDNKATGGFSLADFQAEIDAGRPVLLNLEGHSIVGYGYSGSTVYVRDTWDNDPSHTYTMTWGGSYGGMPLDSVSIVHVQASTPPAAPTGLSATDGAYTNKVHLSWNIATGASRYEIYRNTSNTHTGQTTLTSSATSTAYDDFGVTQDVTYYYWVKACNSAGCSGYSSVDSGYSTSVVAVNLGYLPLVLNQEPPQFIPNGDFEDGRVEWTEYSSGGYQLIYNYPSLAHEGSWLAYLGGYDDALDAVYQDVTFPGHLPILNFYARIDSDDFCGENYFYDYFSLQIGEDSWYIPLCQDTSTSNYIHWTLNVSAYAGRTEPLYFFVSTDYVLDSHFYLDTIYLSESVSSPGSSAILFEGVPDGFELQPLSEGKGFKIKDIN